MSYKTLLSVISILLISIGLRIYSLGDRALWADEKVSALCSNGLIGAQPMDTAATVINSGIKNKSFSEIKKATLIQDSGNGLLYYLFLSHWTDWFGNSDYWLRFPSFLAGVSFLIIGFLFVRKRFNDYSALLFLISSSVFSLFIIYSQTARSYELALFATFSSTFIFCELIDALENKLNKYKILVYSIAYFLLLCICMFLHYYTFYIFAGHAIYLILHHFKNSKIIYLFVGIYASFSIFFLYWMLNGGLEGYSLMAGRNAWWVQQAKDSGTYFNLAFFVKSFITFFAAMTGVYMSYIKGFQVYLLLPFIGALILIALLYFKSTSASTSISNRILNLFIYTIIVQLAFATSMVLKNGHLLSLSPYYNIFTIPYIFILLAFISNEILKKQKFKRAVILFYSFFVIYNLVFLYFYYTKKNIHHSAENNPYIEAASLIEKQISIGDTVVSRQWIDGKLISLYTNKSFLFLYDPYLEKDEIYINKKGNDKLTILNLEGKRY